MPPKSLTSHGEVYPLVQFSRIDCPFPMWGRPLGRPLEFGHSLRTPWATEGSTPCVAAPRTGAWRLSAAVGDTRSIAPGFSRVETAQIELSPCSGRQTAEVGHREIRRGRTTGSRRMRSTCGRESVARYAGSIHEAHRSPG